MTPQELRDRRRQRQRQRNLVDIVRGNQRQVRINKEELAQNAQAQKQADALVESMIDRIFSPIFSALRSR